MTKDMDTAIDEVVAYFPAGCLSSVTVEEAKRMADVSSGFHLTVGYGRTRYSQGETVILLLPSAGRGKPDGFTDGVQFTLVEFPPDIARSLGNAIIGAANEAER